MPREQDLWITKDGKYIYYIIREINGRFDTIMHEKDGQIDEFRLRSLAYFKEECEYLGKAKINYTDLFKKQEN